MRTSRTLARGAVAALIVTATGCADQLPTITGADRFPTGSLPTTLEVTLDAERFVRSDTVYSDFVNPRQAPFLLVARRFDGELDAHTLARFTGFPDTVFATVDGATRTDTVFTYGAGRVISTVTSSASHTPTSPARLQLWELEQAWDSATVTWTTADRSSGAAVPWRTPGGTRGRLLSEAIWTPGDTVARDSVIFRLDSLSVARVAARGHPGLVVTTETAGSRIQLSRLVLSTSVRPASRPDTSVAQTIAQGPQTFIATPAPPRPDSVYRVGGLTGERTVLTLDLTQRVPACANPATTPNCPQLPLREVTLNQAFLVLQPVAVTAGYRPLERADFTVRRLVETELGRRASLAETFAADSLSASLFAAPAGGPVSINLTGAVTQVAATDSATTTIALLGEPEGQRFGYLWFTARPRLRLVYTLPLRPRLP